MELLIHSRGEVVNGPGASVWGANAVNGVMNIITKSAKDTQGGLVSGGGATSASANSVTGAFLTRAEVFPVANRPDAIGSGIFRWLRSRSMHLKLNVVVLLGMLLAGICGEMKAQTRQPAFNENQLEALFLFNFAQFVKWPPHAFTNAESPIIIGVLGEDPFGGLLDELVRGEVIDNRKLEVSRFRRAEDIKTCHVLFIAASEAGKLEQIFRVLEGKPILTVGDSENFALRGGMIRFLAENKKMRLRINLDAVREAKIEISSKLLRPAEIVSGKGGQIRCLETI